jgi:hypothetical protein
MIIIGIDPDSEKHGVAVYNDDGHLVGIDSMELMKIRDMLKGFGSEVRFSIEDVCANNFIYTRNKNKNEKVNQSIARSIGKNQQSQIELMRMLDYLEIKYQLHKPQKGNWAENKKRFEMVTGWTRQSNKDTRSAAFFGFLGLNR